MLIQAKHIVTLLNDLYFTGEYNIHEELNYLYDKRLITKFEGCYSITTSWAILSHQLPKEDFIKTLLAVHPNLLPSLLLSVKGFGKRIADTNDKAGLFQFVNRLKELAADIPIRSESENNHKSVLKYLFKGSISYEPLMRLLEHVQLIQILDPADVSDLSIEPDNNWVENRLVCTQYPITLTNSQNLKVLTHLIISKVEMDEPVKEILSYPWHTFLLVLGMVLTEYNVEDTAGFSLMPENRKKAMSEQKVKVILFSSSGEMRTYGYLQDFSASICSEMGITLFPEKTPPVVPVLFDLINKGVYTYNGSDYQLHNDWIQRVYNRERLLKNKSRAMRRRIKDIIEIMRTSK